MIVVKVELWPGGSETHAREISRAAIANVSGLEEVSDYIAVMRLEGGALEAVTIEGHRRRAGVWPLISRAFATGADPVIRPRDQEIVEAIIERVFFVHEQED